MAEEQLRKAYGLMKQGQTKESLAIVQMVLKQDKNNVSAWWLMTNLLADDPERQKKALEKTLTLDPKHKLALQLQAKLSGSPAPKTSPKPQAKPQSNTTAQQAKADEEIDVDWGKLEAREVAKREVDEAAASKMVTIVTYGMIGFVLLIAIVIGGFIGIPAFQAGQINNPHDTILRFYSAIFSGDVPTARAMVCPDTQAAFDTFGGVYLISLNEFKAQLGEDAVITFDFSGMTAEVVSADAANATVRVAGEYTMTSPLAPEPVTEEIITTDENLDVLRFENGVWCIAKVG